MCGLTVQVERLEPLQVAAIAITSESPEMEAINALVSWARPQRLLAGDFRFFGYDNCEPHPNHIYTAWLTICEGVTPSGGVDVKEFPGGLFAVTEVQGVAQIGPTWKQLVQWCESRQYAFSNQPGLEEYLDMTPDQPLDNQRFKLYLSIKE